MGYTGGRDDAAWWLPGCAPRAARQAELMADDSESWWWTTALVVVSESESNVVAAASQPRMPRSSFSVHIALLVRADGACLVGTRSQLELPPSSAVAAAALKQRIAAADAGAFIALRACARARIYGGGQQRRPVGLYDGQTVQSSSQVPLPLTWEKGYST